MVLYKIFARIDNKLYTELKKLKAHYSMKWTDLFFHLCSTIPQPNLMIQNYAPFYGINEDHNFTIQVEEKTYRTFSIFTATKLALIAAKTPEIKLSRQDTDAMETLRKREERGKPPIDFDLANKLGISIPQRFEDFLKIHEVVGGLQRSLADTTNLATSPRTQLADIDVPFRGERAIVLESIYVERPTQSELGEVNAYISRDDDADLVTFDPAELRGDNVRTDLHIHAFDNMLVEFDLTSGTHNSYKASAVFSVRKIGIGFKAKMLEFLGPNHLPEEIEISTAEKDIIDDLNLLEVARVGMEAIG